MGKDRINVAIVGLGFGAEFIPIYLQHPQARMYAVCQRNPDKLKKVGDDFKVEKRYTNYADVLADKSVDFVHINSPIPDHAPMSIAALKASCSASSARSKSPSRRMRVASTRRDSAM